MVMGAGLGMGERGRVEVANTSQHPAPSPLLCTHSSPSFLLPPSGADAQEAESGFGRRVAVKQLQSIIRKRKKKKKTFKVKAKHSACHSSTRALWRAEFTQTPRMHLHMTTCLAYLFLFRPSVCRTRRHRRRLPSPLTAHLFVVPTAYRAPAATHALHFCSPGTWTDPRARKRGNGNSEGE